MEVIDKNLKNNINFKKILGVFMTPIITCLCFILLFAGAAQSSEQKQDAESSRKRQMIVLGNALVDQAGSDSSLAELRKKMCVAIPGEGSSPVFVSRDSATTAGSLGMALLPVQETTIGLSQYGLAHDDLKALLKNPKLLAATTHVSEEAVQPIMADDVLAASLANELMMRAAETATLPGGFLAFFSPQHFPFAVFLKRFGKGRLVDNYEQALSYDPPLKLASATDKANLWQSFLGRGRLPVSFFARGFDETYKKVAEEWLKLSQISMHPESLANLIKKLKPANKEKDNTRFELSSHSYKADLKAAVGVVSLTILPVEHQPGQKPIFFLPPSIQAFPKLKSLSCTGCGMVSLGNIKKLPIDWLCATENNLSSAELEYFPESLTHLYLFNNPLKDFPVRCAPFVNLRELYLEKTDLEGEIDFSWLPALRCLNAGYNRITQATVPKTVQDITFSGNFFSQLPRGIELCEGLYALEMAQNQLSTFDGTALSTKLVFLSLGDNRLKAINFDLHRYPNLDFLGFQGNQIMEWPQSFSRKSVEAYETARGRMLEMALYYNPAPTDLEIDPHDEAVIDGLRKAAHMRSVHEQ